MFAQPSAAVLNHLLKQNSWALPRLVRFAGKTVRFEITPFSFAWTILHDGMLLTAEDNSIVDALCMIEPSLLPRFLLQDENAYTGIHSEGDAELLKEIFFLSRNLKWDAAEDLSHVTGDIAAERIVQTARKTRQQMRDATINFSRATTEYLTEENPLLAKPRHISEFMQQVDDLRDDAARLEQRIKRLYAD